jgi:hypothetical protein
LDDLGHTLGKLERAKGIEPSYAAWEAAVLPLNYARAVPTLATPGTKPQDGWTHRIYGRIRGRIRVANEMKKRKILQVSRHTMAEDWNAI